MGREEGRRFNVATPELNYDFERLGTATYQRRSIEKFGIVSRVLK